MFQHPLENNSQINAQMWIDFRSNLARFWEGFRGQDGAKMAPNRFKIHPKIDQKNDKLLGRLKIDF